MKKRSKLISIIVLVLFMIILTSCASGKDQVKDWSSDLEIETLACTGTCLTREEMAQLLYNYESVQDKYSGKNITNKISIPELKVVTPGEHKHDENTRYEIGILGMDENDFVTGIKVSVMDDTSACKIEEPEPQQPEETPQETAGLPVEEIVGTYEIVDVMTIHSGDSEFTKEVTWTFTVEAAEGNTIAIKMGGVRFGEGIYDPASGICEVKIAPEWFEAIYSEPQDATERFTFFKKEGKIKFEMIELGKEDAVPGIATKVG